MIKDKYTDRTDLSRQRKYQLRHRDAGLCIKCTEEAVTGGQCLEHAVQSRELTRKRGGFEKRNKSKTYVLLKRISPKKRKAIEQKFESQTSNNQLVEANG